MIRALRAFFLGRSLREEIMVVAFILLIFGWWFSRFEARAAGFLHETKQTTSELNSQAQWLSNRTAIMAAAQESASRFDASRTLNSTALLTEAHNLASEAGLPTPSGDLDPDESNGQFSVHTLRFQIQRADWTSLQNFFLALEKRHPYIGVEQFDLRVDKASKTHGVQLILSSFEISRDNP
ncbi:MAG TPA: GspMb/PilO family protein [Opitutaceae bacterium]|jgi:hypothetical protein|nr:GspMb/PilO family protein [Opitutaceae bacterium]